MDDEVTRASGSHGCTGSVIVAWRRCYFGYSIVFGKRVELSAEKLHPSCNFNLTIGQRRKQVAYK